MRGSSRLGEGVLLTLQLLPLPLPLPIPEDDPSTSSHGTTVIGHGAWLMLMVVGEGR